MKRLLAGFLLIVLVMLSGCHSDMSDEIVGAQRTLTFGGYGGSGAVSLFQEENPEIQIEYVDEMTPEELAERISSKDDQVDIYVVYADYAYASMIQKGLTAPLSSSAILQDVNLMYEPIQDILKDASGNIVAYPAHMDIWEYGINAGYWEMLFGERPLPKTFGEVLDAWIEWEEKYAAQYPGIGFMPMNFDYAGIVQQMISIYIMQLSSEGAPDLDTPVLRSILEKLEKIYNIRLAAGRSVHRDEVDTQILTDSETGPGFIFHITVRNAIVPDSSGAAVMMTAQDYLYGLPKGKMTWLPLTFDDEGGHSTDGRMQVYVINPYSRNIEEAIRYIEYLTRVETNPTMYYAYHPHADEPYEDPRFFERLEKYTAQKSEYEQQVEQAKQQGLDASSLQYQLDYLTSWIANKETAKWLISAENIANYRSMIQNAPLNLHIDSPYISQSGTIACGILDSACERYANGLLSMDMFLKELSEKMQMMYLENQ